jgi:hypothetical protein
MSSSLQQTASIAIELSFLVCEVVIKYFFEAFFWSPELVCELRASG